jgi:hypothetical protein
METRIRTKQLYRGTAQSAAARGVDALVGPLVLAVTAATMALLLYAPTRVDADAASNFPNPLLTPDVTGKLGTFNTSAVTAELNNPFFQSLGTNGRTCVTCHTPTDGCSLTSTEVQLRFTASQGLDPLFCTVDGSNSPTADVSKRLRRGRSPTACCSRKA